MSVAPLRRRAALVAALACAIGLGAPVPSHAQGKSAPNLAMVGEPQTLDPMSTPADLVGTIMQHVYEPLYTFDANWNVVPMLAEAHAHGLGRRQDLQHRAAQGRQAAQRPRADADDVVASPAALDGGLAARQGGGARKWTSLDGQGPAHGGDHAEERLTRRCWRSWRCPRGMAAIMAKESHRAAAHRVRRHRPLQVQGAPARPVRAAGALRRVLGAQGSPERLRRQARSRCSTSCASCRCPTPTRASKARSPASSTTPTCCRSKRWAGSRRPRGKVVPIADAVVRLPLPGVQHQGRRRWRSSRCARRCRPRSAQGEMLAAGFGDTRFFIAEGNHFPKGTPFYSDAGTDALQQARRRRPRPQAEQAGYKGEPIRILTSRQYDFHYNMALVMAEQLKRAGFKADLKWSTGPRWCSAATTRSCGTSTSRIRACSPSRCCRRRSWATARRAGGARRPSRRRWPRFNAGARPGQARPAVGQGAAGRCTTRCPTSTSASSTACRRARRRWRATRRHLAVLLEHRPEELEPPRTATSRLRSDLA